MARARLTPNQHDRLLRLARPMHRDRWILGRECGGEAALDHLTAKGYAERKLEYGPRGGHLYHYRLTDAGWAVYDRHAAKTAEAKAAAREQETSTIDGLLIEARKTGGIARVFVGSMEFRGYVGEVERVEDWDAGTSTVVVPIGHHKIPLTTITKVEIAA